MNEIEQKDKIVLAELGVGLVVTFGSAVTGNRHPKSDVDIGIKFIDRERLVMDPVETYGSLQQIFGTVYPNQNLDIVYLHEAPLALQFKAVQEGELLFSQSDILAADYKEWVMKLYFDWQPVEREWRKAILK